VSAVAVIASSRKTLGGGLPELRRTLKRHGIDEFAWHEVARSRDAPERVHAARAEGAELVFVWGGDGMVQHCVSALAGTDTAVAIIPAGTANLFAGNLKIPRSIERAVEIGLRGDRRRIDLGRLNGERFAVFGGAGFDAKMVRDARPRLKARLGRVAYVWSGIINLGTPAFRARIRVDGDEWYAGKATCILVGNIGALSGVDLFDAGRPDDGVLDLGVVSAEGVIQWSRTFARVLTGRASDSPFVQVTKGREIDVTLSRKVLYELDGGVRKKTKRLRLAVEPAAITVCVPRA
jgi:diacylglycerol kinase (ATP)